MQGVKITLDLVVALASTRHAEIPTHSSASTPEAQAISGLMLQLSLAWVCDCTMTELRASGLLLFALDD